MKEKNLLLVMKNAYYNYYKNHGNPPTQINVGIQHKDEWLKNTYSAMCNITDYSVQDSFLGIPIKWTRCKRIECLPRRKKYNYPSSFAPFTSLFNLKPKDSSSQ